MQERLLSRIFLCLFSAFWLHPHWWLYIVSWTAVFVPEVPVLRETSCGCSVPHCCKHGPDTVCCGPGGVCRALLESRGTNPGGDGCCLESRNFWSWEEMWGEGTFSRVLLLSLWWLFVQAPWAWTIVAGYAVCWLKNIAWKGNAAVSWQLLTAPSAQPRSEWVHHQCWLPTLLWKWRECRLSWFVYPVPLISATFVQLFIWQRTPRNKDSLFQASSQYITSVFDREWMQAAGNTSCTPYHMQFKHLSPLLYTRSSGSESYILQPQITEIQ